VGACVLANPGIVATGAGIGMALGALADGIDDTIDQIIHGNSLLSPRQTTVYQLVDGDGNVLKYGITSEPVPEDRYSDAFYEANGASMETLATYPWRSIARADEFSRCTVYTVSNGHLPPLSSRC